MQKTADQRGGTDSRERDKIDSGRTEKQTGKSNSFSSFAHHVPCILPLLSSSPPHSRVLLIDSLRGPHKPTRPSAFFSPNRLNFNFLGCIFIKIYLFIFIYLVIYSYIYLYVFLREFIHFYLYLYFLTLLVSCYYLFLF